MGGKVGLAVSEPPLSMYDNDFFQKNLVGRCQRIKR